MHTRRRCAPITLALTLLASTAFAQTPVWTELPELWQRQHHAMAYDVGRSETVLFGGVDRGGQELADTWIWDGSTWAQRFADRWPDARRGHAMAHDVARRMTVLFGGRSGSTLLGDTWLWDGKSWVEAKVSGPPARTGHVLVHDAARQRTVLFGGLTASGPAKDTWEWDGAAWTQVNVAGPPARTEAAAAWSLGLGQVVLHGGRNGTLQLADTWHYDGRRWTSLQAGPVARSEHVMVYDARRGRLIVHGGTNGRFAIAAVHEWDGVAWRSLNLSPAPPPMLGHAFVHDVTRARNVLLGASTGGAGRETWEMQSATPPAMPSWSDVTPVWRTPRAGAGAVMAYHEGVDKAILHNTTGIWIFANEQWSPFTGSGPSIRDRAQIAYDAQRGEVVLFGGLQPASNSGLGDTWTWDGLAWTKHAPSTSPPARFQGGMTFDERRGRIVMFGGLRTNLSTSLGDTWEWDGRDWRQMQPPSGPSPRHAVAMAYDPIRGEVVLHGGRLGGTTIHADMWSWNGARWTKLAQGSTQPGALHHHRMATDTVRHRIVLTGGYSGIRVENTAMEWDGSSWSKIAAGVQTRRALHAMAFASATCRMLLYGGEPSTTTQLDDTWTYGLPRAQAFVTVLGTGCRGSGGIPVLDPVAGSRPWIGKSYEVAAGNLPVNARSWFLDLGAQSLAIDLGIIGMPGCVLRQDRLLTFSVAATGTFGIRIPFDPALIGARFYQQGFALDTSANALGAVVTNGLAVTVGSR